ncbi:hypothetical protein KUV57_23430 [Epibacterium sp. DP7N7-1]|nr:hypothetical protein [Epibacterium sp. DP7N7-1]
MKHRQETLHHGQHRKSFTKPNIYVECGDLPEGPSLLTSDRDRGSLTQPTAALAGRIAAIGIGDEGPLWAARVHKMDHGTMLCTFRFLRFADIQARRSIALIISAARKSALGRPFALAEKVSLRLA